MILGNVVLRPKVTYLLYIFKISRMPRIEEQKPSFVLIKLRFP